MAGPEHLFRNGCVIIIRQQRSMEAFPMLQEHSPACVIRFFSRFYHIHFRPFIAGIIKRDRPDHVGKDILPLRVKMAQYLFLVFFKGTHFRKRFPDIIGFQLPDLKLPLPINSLPAEILCFF